MTPAQARRRMETLRRRAHELAAGLEMLAAAAEAAEHSTPLQHSQLLNVRQEARLLASVIYQAA